MNQNNFFSTFFKPKIKFGPKLAYCLKLLKIQIFQETLHAITKKRWFYVF